MPDIPEYSDDEFVSRVEAALTDQRTKPMSASEIMKAICPDCGEEFYGASCVEDYDTHMNREHRPQRLSASDVEGKCGHCGFTIHPSESGIRYFGTYRAHAEDRCRDLMRTELARLNAELTRLQGCLDRANSNVIDGGMKLRKAETHGKLLAEALKLAQPIVQSDYETAKEYCDSDWEGMSFQALEAINTALQQCEEMKSNGDL